MSSEKTATLTAEDIAKALAWAKSATMVQSQYYAFERSKIAVLITHIEAQAVQIAQMKEIVGTAHDYIFGPPGPHVSNGEYKAWQKVMLEKLTTLLQQRILFKAKL